MSLIFSMFSMETIVSASLIILGLVFLTHKWQGVITVTIVGFLAMNPSVLMPFIKSISSENTGYSSGIQHVKPTIDNGVIKSVPKSNNAIVKPQSIDKVVDNKLEAIYDVLMMNMPSVLGALSITGKVFSSDILVGNVFGGKISTAGDLERYTVKTCDTNGEENLTFSPLYKTENIPLTMCINDCIVVFAEDKSIVKPIVNNQDELQFIRMGMSRTSGERCTGV